jgi:putative tricarboxylic transport membrane protein
LSDRLTGLVLLVLSVAYGVAASGFQAMIGDPLGPAVFPLVLAIPLAAFSLYLLLRPDPEPDWPRGRAWFKQALSVAALLAYAYLLEPLGFVLTTLLAVVALACLLGGKPWQAAVAGAIIAVVLFVLFNNLLSLPLPTGVLGFLG